MLSKVIRACDPVYGYHKMLFKEVINQYKKHMARVCNLYRERVRSIKTVLFLIVASISLSSGETVLTKYRPCQNKILTTTVAAVKNQERRIQNKMKVLKQDCWKKFVETNSKISQVYGEQT